MSEASLALGAFPAVFAPLDAESRSQTVRRRLGDAITLGLLPDGMPLPPEPELAERFGVATTTVREALGALRQDELIRTRRGRGGGSFVLGPADGGRAALLQRLRELGRGELRDLGEHYAAIAGTCAELAAQRADDDDLRRLASGAASAKDDGAGEWLRAEGAFHLQLAVCAHSPRLTRAEISLQAEVGPLLWFSHALDADSRSCAARRHAAVVRAVRSGRPGAARNAIAAHVQDLVAALGPLHREARRSR